MAVGKRPAGRQDEMYVATSEIRRLSHPFYQALERMLKNEGFDAFAEETCREFYAEKNGRPGIPPGVYYSGRELALKTNTAIGRARQRTGVAVANVNAFKINVRGSKTRLAGAVRLNRRKAPGRRIRRATTKAGDGSKYRLGLPESDTETRRDSGAIGIELPPSIQGRNGFWVNANDD